MNFSLIFIIPLFLFLLGGGVNSQTDSCSSNLNLSGQNLPFDTTNLHCNPVWDSHGYILRYAQEGPNLWNFLLSAPNTNGYVAIGFSPNGNMVGSDAVVGWVPTDGGAATIKKYFLGGTSPDRVTLNGGDLQVLTNTTSIFVVSSRIYMAFQLGMNQPSSHLLYSLGPAGRLPAGPGFLLTEHRDMVATTLNYATGVSRRQGRPYKEVRKSHGMLNMFGWGIMMPIGAIVARYFKKYDPIWFYAHISIQSLGFILGFSGVICGLVLEDKLNASVDAHKGIGVFILSLGCLQVMAILARPEKTAKYRKYWNWYHYTVGRLVIFFATVNVFYGIHLGDAGTAWTASFAVLLVSFFLIAAFLEFRMSKQN